MGDFKRYASQTFYSAFPHRRSIGTRGRCRIQTRSSSPPRRSGARGWVPDRRRQGRRPPSQRHTHCAMFVYRRLSVPLRLQAPRRRADTCAPPYPSGSNPSMESARVVKRCGDDRVHATVTPDAMDSPCPSPRPGGRSGRAATLGDPQPGPFVTRKPIAVHGRELQRELVLGAGGNAHRCNANSSSSFAPPAGSGECLRSNTSVSSIQVRSIRAPDINASVLSRFHSPNGLRR